MKRSILTLSLLSALAVTSCQRDFDEVTPQSAPQTSETGSPTAPARAFLSTQGAEAGILYIRIQRSAKSSLRAFDGNSSMSVPALADGSVPA